VELQLLILEKPWLPIINDMGQTSVLGFFQGLSRNHQNLRHLYLNFADEASFEYALEHLLRNNTAFRKILYVAAHGSNDSIGDIELGSVCDLIHNIAEHRHLEGVIFDSCYVGNNFTEISKMLAGSHIRWCFGYANSVDWFSSTIINLSVIESFVFQINNENKLEPTTIYRDTDYLLERLKNALSIFSGAYPAGDSGNNNERQLKNCIKLYFQAFRQGSNPADITQQLITKLRW